MRAKNPPTAIIFNNDAMALGGCRALVEMGLKPGKDVAVIVIVDTALCRYLLAAADQLSARRWSRSAGASPKMLLAFMPAFAGPDGARKSSARSGRWNSSRATAIEHLWFRERRAVDDARREVTEL